MSIDDTIGAALARHVFFDDRDLLVAHIAANSSLWHVRYIKFALRLRRYAGGEARR